VSPILAPNRHRYPTDWPEIRARILRRARNRCEECGVPNHAVGYRDGEKVWHPLCGSGPCDAAGEGREWPGYTRELSFSDACEFAEVQNCCEGAKDDDGNHWMVIVLTISHTDHDPGNCADDNLRALCQQCHNRHDRKHRDHTRRYGCEVGQLALELGE